MDNGRAADAEKTVTSFFTRALDYFLPQALRDDPESERRGRIVVGMSLGFGSVFSIGLLLRLAVAVPGGGLPFGIANILIFFLAPLVLRATGRPEITAGLMVFSLCFGMSFVAYQEGGLRSPVLVILPVLPLLATFTINRGAGALTALVVALSFAAAAVAVWHGFLPVSPFPYSAPQEAVLRAITSSLTAIAVALLAWIYEARRVQAATRLRAARDAAETANRAKSCFLANMSHEIRTPMTGILGVAELLGEHEMSPEACDYLATISSSAENLKRIIDDTLDFSKIEVGELVLEETDFSLRTTVREVIDLLRPLAEAKKIELRTSIATELGDRRSGDPPRLRQVLINLVGNAIKFTEQGWVELRIEPGSGPGGSGQANVFFFVRDTGIGIAPEAMGRLFTPFYQADNSLTRRFGGTGLGLAISRRLAELMAGSIEVESSPGKGSSFVFSVRLPRATGTPDVPAGPPSAPASEHRPADPKARNQRILLVEDEPVSQMVAEAHLKQLGFEVDLADNGQDALVAIESGDYALILMDCQMPVLDGYETTRRLRRRERGHLPVIGFTAHAMRGDREKCLAAGMDDYLTKPFRRRDLSAAVHRWASVDP